MPGLNAFDLPYPHIAYVGTTGTGKTTKFFNDFERSKLGGIYFNFTHVPCPFTFVDGSYDSEDIISAIHHGEKLNFYLNRDKKYAKTQVAYIVRELFKACDNGVFTIDNPFVFSLDEAHNLGHEGERNDSLEMVWTGGRSAGFHAILITQSPASVSKILIRQCDTQVMFSLNDFERDYFKGKGFDFDQMQGLVRSKIENVMSHKYVVYVNGSLKGPFEEKI